MAEKIIVAVGSLNPVKIEAARQAFAKVFPDKELDVVCYDVPSSVPLQPMDDETTMIGAMNRAMRSAQKNPQADYCVGFEGGLGQTSGHWFSRAWVSILIGGKFRFASTQSFAVPDEIMLEIRKGKELGTVCDEFFGTVNSKHHGGYFGLMTNGLITRMDAYRDACIVALIHQMRKELF